MRCKHDDCPRRPYTSGWCSTHYRRLRSGQPMGAPIRRYVRLQEQGSTTGTRQPREVAVVSGRGHSRPSGRC
jgi:hypothetical protein